jgi:hypothetical protein
MDSVVSSLLYALMRLSFLAWPMALRALCLDIDEDDAAAAPARAAASGTDGHPCGLPDSGLARAERRRWAARGRTRQCGAVGAEG